MNNSAIIGIDLGGTNIRSAIVANGKLSAMSSQKIHADGSEDEVLQQLFSAIDALIYSSVSAIGIGVPGLVDFKQGMLYDVINIPSWKELPLQKWMEDRYQIPVVINNDANCFALGEFYFGKGKGTHSMIGLTVGTGLGTGIVINNQLYSGANGGAGEFGMADYLDKCYEYYASGQFFQNVYGMNGEAVFQLAEQGNEEAIKMYEEMGTHLGNAIKMMMYTVDPELIVLGGSVRHAYRYFRKTMWQQIETMAYKKPKENLQIQISELENSGILGAAALCFAPNP